MERYYDSQTGRYSQSDPIGLAGGINTYGYARANPLRWIDPSGRDGTLPGIVPGPLPFYIPPVAIPGTKENGDFTRAAGDLIDSISGIFSSSSPQASTVPPTASATPAPPSTMGSDLTDEASDAGRDAAHDVDGTESCPGKDNDPERCKKVTIACKNVCISSALSARFARRELGSWIQVCTNQCASAFGCGTYHK